MIREVMSGLRFLPEDDRALIVMRYVDDLRPKEIAEILEVNANAVSVRLNRAVEKLKEKIRVA